jgi:antitoxin VapB
MNETRIARIINRGPSQVVCLPLAFHLPGDRVRVRRVTGGILLESVITDLDDWFRAMDEFVDVPFLEDGRRQPALPRAESLFE